MTNNCYWTTGHPLDCKRNDQSTKSHSNWPVVWPLASALTLPVAQFQVQSHWLVTFSFSCICPHTLWHIIRVTWTSIFHTLVLSFSPILSSFISLKQSKKRTKVREREVSDSLFPCYFKLINHTARQCENPPFGRRKKCP